MLDESLEILAAAWAGEPVHHRGEHYIVDGIQFLPRPMQRPGVPVWVAGFPGKAKQLRRASRHDGFFPVNLDHPDQLAETVATLTDLRRHTTAPYDIVAALRSVSTRRPTPRGAPRGGCRSSHRRQSRWTE